MMQFLNHLGMTILENRPVESSVDAGVLKRCVASKVSEIATALPSFLRNAGAVKAVKGENLGSMDDQQKTGQRELCAVRLLPRAAIVHILKGHQPTNTIACANFNMSRCGFSANHECKEKTGNGADAPKVNLHAPRSTLLAHYCALW